MSQLAEARIRAISMEMIPRTTRAQKMDALSSQANLAGYVTVILAIFVFNPVAGVKQVTVVLIAWLHACIGLHFWLRIRPWYAAVQPYAFAAALLLPAVSLAGFLAAGREVARLAADPDWLAATLTRVHAVDAAGLAQIKDLDQPGLIRITP